MDWQTPLSTDVSLLSGRHDVETLANAITDVDVLYFQNLSYEDLIEPRRSTRLHAIQMRSNTLLVHAIACITVDGDSVKFVVEVARVRISRYARSMQWADHCDSVFSSQETTTPRQLWLLPFQTFVRILCVESSLLAFSPIIITRHIENYGPGSQGFRF